ncbi:MAG TPA: thioredoxin domain-containing protein, partial [Longimicrobiales bacterium]|nr:thioredoxin domain-containing protein [Longimicrobiales bacterium]
MTNLLARESSPYLLQHADNPVDWYPWGEAALEKARREDRPILLSIGYSSCHWCHVMAHESFEDPEIAELMNEAFVCVKVDREERPDLDQVYMNAVQAMSGQGGWPLTAFLTPEGVPYYGGTYFPPEPRHGMPSFRQVLKATRDAFRNRREEVEEAAEELVAALRRSATERDDGSGAYGAREAAPGEELLGHAWSFASSRYDGTNGGFGSAPKFPQSPTLDFVLRWHHRSGEEEALRLVEHTLRAMARGGIRDHLAGGFHRYSVDARWLVPHFEKMLYDNALLARLYLDGWRATGDEELRRVAEDTLDWLLEEMRAPEGGFYAALDADSEGEEGRFYVWSREEVDRELTADEARLFRRCYDVSEGGNWEGTNILHRPHELEAVAGSEGIEVAELRELLAEARKKLRARREERERPFRDEKVLTGWNALAIRALAAAGAATGRDDYLVAARETAGFLLDSLRREGELLHSWKDGDARVGGFLDDYAGLGNALLDLHEATLEGRWLKEVPWVIEAVLERFWEDDADLFYDAPAGGEELVVRPRGPMDNPTPSGTSLAVELLLRGALVLGREEWRDVAERALAREAGAMERYPLAFGSLLSALDFSLAAPVEVAIVGDPEEGETRSLL